MADEAVVKRRRVDETAVAGGTPTSHGESASLEDVDDAELDDDLQADDLFKGSVLPEGEDADAAVSSRVRNDRKREMALPEFLQSLEHFQPVIPDAVASYYLQKAGFDCEDVRIKRLIALAAQKFVADVARDAMAYCRTRSNAGQSASKSSRGTKGDKKLVLTMEDLSLALKEYDIDLSKPEYYL